MRIKFENVGRLKKSWVAEYPGEVPLEAAIENDDWWFRQLRDKLLSRDFDWGYDEANDCVYIFAGWHLVGKAYVQKEGTVAGE